MLLLKIVTIPLVATQGNAYQKSSKIHVTALYSVFNIMNIFPVIWFPPLVYVRRRSTRLSFLCLSSFSSCPRLDSFTPHFVHKV